MGILVLRGKDYCDKGATMRSSILNLDGAKL